MVVEVGPEIEQLVFEVCRRPEQRVIQVFPPQGADQPFDERMGQGNVGDGLDFCHFQYPQIGLPLVEPIERIIVRAEVLRHPVLASNGAVEHPTQRGTIDRSRMDTEPNDPARVLIHDDQDPVGPQGGRLAPEQIHAPETVFYVAQESQPGRTTRVLSRPVALGENPANHVFVDLDLERQGNLLSDSRTAPVGIPLLHFDYRTDELCTRSFRAGLPTAIRGEQHAVLLLVQGFVKAKQCRRLQNDCGTEQTSGTHQERHQAGEDAV